MNRNYVPIFLETSNLKIIVFGGGNVALRKCTYFQDAKLTVVAREILPELESIAAETVIGDIPDDVSQMIDPYDMVVAATDDKKLNDRIRDDAIRMGMTINSAHGGGNVLIPSVLERENYTVAISSLGRVPAFPPYMVKELDSFLDGRYDRMMDLMIDVREYAMGHIPTQHERREFLESVIYDSDIGNAVADGNMDKAKELSLKKVKG